MILTKEQLRTRAKQPRESLPVEQLAFRVDLVCSCNNDIAFGYGETVDLARQLAQFCLRRDHGRLVKVRTEIVQKLVDGWRYEEVASS